MKEFEKWFKEDSEDPEKEWADRESVFYGIEILEKAWQESAEQKQAEIVEMVEKLSTDSFGVRCNNSLMAIYSDLVVRIKQGES